MIRSAPDPVGERDKLGEEKSAAVGSAERCSYQPLWTPSAAMVRPPQLICVAEAAAAAPCGPVAESSLGQAFPAAGQHLEPDTAGGEVAHGVDQLVQIPAEPVRLPHNQPIALPQRLQAGGEPGAVVGAPRRVVLVELGGIDTGGEQGVALQGDGLRAVGFGHPHVADQQASPPSRIRSIK